MRQAEVTPPARHGCVFPVLHVPLGAAGDGDHALDRVRGRQGALQSIGEAEAADGEHLLQPFPDTRRRRRVRPVKGGSEFAGGPQPQIEVGVGESADQPAVDDLLLPIG